MSIIDVWEGAIICLEVVRGQSRGWGWQQRDDCKIFPVSVCLHSSFSSHSPQPVHPAHYTVIIELRRATSTPSLWQRKYEGRPGSRCWQELQILLFSLKDLEFSEKLRNLIGVYISVWLTDIYWERCNVTAINIFYVNLNELFDTFSKIFSRRSIVVPWCWLL